MDIKRIFIQGAGTMGNGIAQVSAQAGYRCRDDGPFGGVRPEGDGCDREEPPEDGREGKDES